MQELLDRQEQSEALSLGQGREQFDRRLEAAQSGKAGAAFGAARRLLSDGTAAMIEALTEWIAERGGRGRPHAALSWINEAGVEQAAYLTMLAVLNHIYGRERATTVAREISDRIALEHRARQLKEHAPGLFAYKLPKLQASTSLRHTKFSLGQTVSYAEVPVKEMTEYERVQVGMLLLDLCRASTGLIHLETQPVRKGKRVHKETYIWPTEETQEWLAKRNEILAAASVRHRPMVLPPLDWDLGDRGGYLFGLKGSIPLVNTWNDTHTEEIENAPMKLVYRALNGMQRTPWAVNNRVLGVVTQVMEQGGGRYDSTDRVLIDRASVPMLEPIEMPPKPNDIDTNDEANRVWRREASYRKGVENTERQSKVRSFWRTFSIAREYTQSRAFFFPWNLDFRGRMYPVTDGGLSPQGDDLSRGLLTFAFGKPLGTPEAVEALMMHGASCLDEWQGSKVGTMTKVERYALIQGLSPRILEVAADPLTNDWWMEADKPLMFLAFCFEWEGYMEHGLDFNSRLPVHVDGSCNGIQHMAAMMEDEATAREVNVTPNERPHDLYAAMAEYAVEALSVLAVSNNDPLTRTLASLWVDSGLVNRKACKRPTMTFGYGGTQYGFTDQLRAHFKDTGEAGRMLDHFHLEGEDRSHYGMALRVLARVIYEGLAEVVPGAFAVREWLQGAASEATVNGATLIKWTVPGTGFPVHQQYNLTTSTQIRTTLSDGVLIKPRVGSVLPDTDARKHRNGIAPNYIHSLDAAHLCLTVDCMGGTPINAVHDSYGCHAAEVPKLAVCLRATFVGLYSDEVAAKLQQEIGATEPPPHVGDLDLTTVLGAEYFFA